MRVTGTEVKFVPEAMRCGALLDPRHQGGEHVELIGPRSAAAVPQIRNKVKPGEFLGLRRAAILGRERVKIRDSALDRREGIAHAV